MRTHGWRGDPPRDDEEARRRIIGATVRCVERFGVRKTGFTQVAEDLGVTRATIYRYFRNIEDLMRATGLAVAADMEERMAAETASLTGPVEILVEVFARSVEYMPKEPYVRMILGTARMRSLGPDMLSPGAREELKDFMLRLDVDWPALGYDDAGLDGLAEFFLRLMFSYLAVPDAAGDPRPFLRRWLAPGLVVAGSGPRVSAG
jgi:AcrR family transcriptional regulator